MSSTPADEVVEIENALLPLFKNGHYEDMEAAANDFLKEVESRHPKMSNAKVKSYLLTRRGQAKYMQVNFKEAESDYGLAVAADPEQAQAYFLRGTVVYRMGRYDEALADFDRARKLEPRNTEFELGYQNCKDHLGAK